MPYDRRRAIIEIAKRMRLPADEAERFVLMARATDSRSRSARNDATHRLTASEVAGGLRPDVAETLATLERIFSGTAAPAPTTARGPPRR